MRDPYILENSDVLSNRLSIRDKETLDAFERDITAGKIAQISRVKGSFDYEHYARMHEFIFGDIYEWAGKERTIPIEKSERVLDGMSVTYSQPKNIRKDAEKVLTSLNKVDWSALPNNKKAEKFATNIAALWQTHPFREGNTRTAITFACEFADAHGFSMDRKVLTENPAHVRDSLVMASLGEYAEPEYLTKIFNKAIENGTKDCSKNIATEYCKAPDSSRYDAVIADTSIPQSCNSKDDYYKKPCKQLILCFNEHRIHFSFNHKIHCWFDITRLAPRRVVHKW